TTVMVNLEIPEQAGRALDRKGVTAEGAIVRCRPVGQKKENAQYDVAIFFQNISEEGRRLIEDYVHRKQAVELPAVDDQSRPGRRALREFRRALTTRGIPWKSETTRTSSNDPSSPTSCATASA